MKNIKMFKKLISITLSAATLFSTMMLPAQAIVVGEDAYITTTTLTRYYCDTETTETFTVSNDDNMYSGTSTYDFLSDEELERCSTNSVADGDATIQAVIGTDDRVLLPAGVSWFTANVLILQRFDTDGDYLGDIFSVGTGFLVADNVVVTALHCIYPYGEVSDIPENADLVSTQIYHGVSSQVSVDDPLSMLIGKTYSQIESVTYDARYFTALESGGYSSAYDWCVITLKDEFNSYYFDCGIAVSSIENTQVVVSGYPRGENDEYLFGLMFAGGEVTCYDGTILTHDVDTSGGQSGAPVWTNALTGDYQVYGIHLSGLSHEDTKEGIENYARAITPAIYNTIVEIMLDS